MSAVPSGTRIFAITPSSIASYSIVALSVSISARMSPALTLSPSFLSHLARFPFSMVGDSAGIRMLIGIDPAKGLAGSGLLGAGGLDLDFALVRGAGFVRDAGVARRPAGFAAPESLSER